MLRQRGNIQKLEFLNGKCRNCVRAWLKLGDLLTCDNNFCVNKRQLLLVDLQLKCNISCHFEAIIYALISCRVMFLIEISTSSIFFLRVSGLA